MYTSFRIQNFKGFKDLAFDDLARVNLIAGKNNTGKTSVLEAIALRAGDLDLRNFVRGRNRSDESMHADVSMFFHNVSDGNRIVLSGEQAHVTDIDDYYPHLVLEGPNSEYRKLFEALEKASYAFRKPPNFFIAEDAKFIFVTEKAPPSDEEERSHISGFVIDNVVHFEIINAISNKLPVVFVRTENDTNNELSAERFSDLDIKNETGILVKTLQLIEPRLQQLKLIVKSSTPLIYGDTGTKKLLPIAFMGEGMVRIANLILAISSVKEGIILIDEIENGLHYSILPDVWRAINEASRLFNVQVFATTHSREVIAAAHEVFSESQNTNGGEGYDFRYHRLTRRADDGDIVLTTYTPDVLSASLENDYEVR